MGITQELANKIGPNFYHKVGPLIHFLHLIPSLGVLWLVPYSKKIKVLHEVIFLITVYPFTMIMSFGIAIAVSNVHP